VIAAIYARKSTQQDVADDAKSVPRQIEHARRYAARKGWSIDEDAIFADDGSAAQSSPDGPDCCA
jgi:DNA invertase Pin-like site-specific DNA recombinase